MLHRIIETGVLEGSVLGPLFIKYHLNLFADDTSLFSVVKDPNTSALGLNHDLDLISQWMHQCL